MLNSKLKAPLGAFLIFLLTSCTLLDGGKPTLVFVHGAHFDERSFDPLVALLGKYRTKQVRLPGRNGRSEGASLEAYGRSVCDDINKNSILVGHSQGGAVINEAVGICPEKIIGLVYL